MLYRYQAWTRVRECVHVACGRSMLYVVFFSHLKYPLFLKRLSCKLTVKILPFTASAFPNSFLSLSTTHTYRRKKSRESVECVKS